MVIGDAVMEDASGCYVRGDGQLVAALGVEDLIIAASPDVVLVTSRKRDQDVGKLLKLNEQQMVWALGLAASQPVVWLEPPSPSQ